MLDDSRSFFAQPAELIKQTMAESHEKLITGFKTIEGHLSGFRDYQGLVTPARKAEGVQGFIDLAIQQGGREAHSEIFHVVTNKFKRAVTMSSLIKSFNQEEREFVETYIGTITPDPVDIPKLFSEAASQVKESGQGILNGTADVVKAAASVHMKIGEVHAFKDANGRLSRLWMNVMLMLGGHRPVAIPDDAEYTEAVMKEASGYTGFFEQYLRQVINWNRAQGR